MQHARGAARACIKVPGVEIWDCSSPYRQHITSLILSDPVCASQPAPLFSGTPKAMKVAIAGTNCLAYWLAQCLSSHISHQFIILSRSVCRFPVLTISP